MSRRTELVKIARILMTTLFYIIVANMQREFRGHLFKIVDNSWNNNCDYAGSIIYLMIFGFKIAVMMTRTIVLFL